MAKLRRFSGTPVAEGVRLEVGKYTVFAVRNEKKDISVRQRREPRKLLRALLHIPFLRGVARLLRDLYRFFDGLSESVELDPQRPVRGTSAEQRVATFLHISPQSIVTLLSALCLPLIAFCCMLAAPKGVEALLRVSTNVTRAQTNAIVCAVRIFGLLAAVGFGGRLRVLKRLLMYKGALNKCINCYECRDEMSCEAAAQYPIITRRSESAFLLSVTIISIILFSMIRADGLLLNAAIRIGIVLGVAALLNEPFSALESADMTLPVRIARAPLDFLQYLTTLEPHPQMMEVAMCAFHAALGEEDDAPCEASPESAVEETKNTEEITPSEGEDNA